MKTLLILFMIYFLIGALVSVFALINTLKSEDLSSEEEEILDLLKKSTPFAIISFILLSLVWPTLLFQGKDKE